MGHLAEHVERTSHVDFLTGLHVEQRKIYSAPPAVRRLGCDITFGEKFLLYEIRIKIFLHADVIIFYTPHDEMLYGTLRPVTVKHFHPVTLDIKLVAHCLKRSCRLFGNYRAWLFISVNLIADEIIC